VDESEAVLMGEHVISPIIWSPDGKMIACRGIMPGFKKMGFVTISVDEQGKTSGMPILLKEERLNVTKRLLHWTSDGKIIFLREDFQQALYVAEVAGSEPVFVADDTQLVFDGLSWMPDGKSFFLPNGKDQRPGFLDIESGKFFELRIDELDIFVSGAVLSPDGKTVAFSAIGRENLIPQDGSMLPKGGVQIYTAPASGGKPTQLTEGEFYNFDIHWSNDSKNIAFTHAEIAREKNFSSKICVMSVNGGEVRALTKAGFYLEPTWSLDDKMIAYVHLRSRKDEVFNLEEMEGDIYVVPAKKTADRPATGGEPKQITDTPEREYNIHWSPDGNMIAFDTNGKAWVAQCRRGSTPSGTVSTPSGTDGKPRLVSETSTGGQGPSRWTPDGKYLICTRGRGFWKMPVESGGEPVELPIRVQSKSLYSPVLSPDGKKVAFKAGASEIQYWMMER
jgi:Tol biopolymer transport system component